MAARRRAPTETARVRHLLSLDATRVMARLAKRQDELVALFSRLRSREPMLESLETWFDSITFSQLSLLEPGEQRAVATFFGLVDETRWYLAYTEDMPGQLQLKLTQLVRKLDDAFRELLATLGPPEADGAPVIDVTPKAKTKRASGHR